MNISKIALFSAMDKNGIETIKELASLCGVSRQTLSYIVSGKSCRFDVIKKIANALRVDVTELIKE